jgi:glycerol-3-phosphate dehydrogenase (NAD(P)+)
MKAAVLGAGSWGTTLALVLHENGHAVKCWTPEVTDIEDIKKTGENKRFLPGVPLPPSLHFSDDLAGVLDKASYIVMAVPSHAVRAVTGRCAGLTGKNAIWISVAKGIENDTLLRVSQVIEQVGGIPPDHIAVLSGPSHAEEVGRKVPTAVVAASISQDTARKVQNMFINDFFRVYANLDIIGVEFGGALKNIIALAAGICDGAGFGDNTKAALMTRGLVEMNRLGVVMGAKPDTFAGLSGVGDLIVTCMSRHSRNRHVGEEIGKGRTLSDVLAEMVMVAEGVKTTRSAYQLAKKYHVDMPITEQVYFTLFENKPPIGAMRDLMTRASKIEDWG